MLLFCLLIVGLHYFEKCVIEPPVANIEQQMDPEPDTIDCGSCINVIDSVIPKTGKIFDRPMDSVRVEKRFFRSWFPLVENKPKNYGEKIYYRIK